MMIKVVNTELLAGNAGTRIILRPTDPSMPITVAARRAMKSHSQVTSVAPVGNSNKVAVTVASVGVAAASLMRDDFVADLDERAALAV